MNRTHPQVDEHLRTAPKWRAEMKQLRRILLDTPLTEDFKWRIPCYTFENHNIVGLNGLKESCALSFFKGVLLPDPQGILLKPGENSQSGRWVKFTQVQEILALEPVLKAYVQAAIAAEQAGLKVVYKKHSELVFAQELLDKLAANPALKTAFQALTPGRQRAYNLYFTAAKQAKTRVARVESCLPKILQGKGFNDCVCGRSKKLPACDGSHKHIR